MAGRNKPGRRPHPPEVVAACKRLLAQGKTERQIVAELRISKGTVGAIRSGRYGKAPPSPRQHKLRKPVRCRGCGGMITEAPCRICYSRNFGRIAQPNDAPSPYLYPRRVG